LELGISILDKIAFSSEQQCKRTEQRVQELSDKKDRLEKLIANILNGEGYSKLKAIVKENVKAVLSDNKIFLSAAFAALLQTLKDNPELVNLIYSISSANSSKQHEDDNSNNITQYIESNKDRLSDSAEKNYENLVKALTDNTINTAATADSSSNATLSFQSSAIFPSQLNQSNSYRIENPEYYHNSKGDIAD
jgi:hypothetical protein